jgi:hypothetical protein
LTASVLSVDGSIKCEGMSGKYITVKNVQEVFMQIIVIIIIIIHSIRIIIIIVLDTELVYLSDYECFYYFLL